MLQCPCKQFKTNEFQNRMSLKPSREIPWRFISLYVGCLIDNVYISLALIFGMRLLAYAYLAFGFWHLLFGIQCFKKHFVSISSVTFWYLYCTHAFKGVKSLPEAESVLTLRIQTRHSRSIRLHMHLNI